MISVTIICNNEEKNIEECIKSVLWADEIIVVDSFSEDKTIELAKKYTDKVFQNKWEGYAKQREFAVSKVSNQWIFSLDADERCTENLKNEIIDVIEKSDNKYNGFRIPRKNYFLGKWIKNCGWYPGYQMRLFKKDKVIVTDRLVHEGYKAEGLTGVLENDIIHYTVVSISDYVKKINIYSSLQAEEKINKRKVTLLFLLFRPYVSFIQQFILKKGFLDGIYGLMVTFFDVITNTLTNMKIREMQDKEKKQ